MTFNRRDSIGRSDVYNNPYDLRHTSNPTMKKFRAEGFQDTMSSPSTAMERDLMRQLQEKLKVPEGAVLYVVYAGKGLFYVLMMPTYLLLFTVPKWLLMQGGPALTNAIKNAARHFNDFFNMAMLKQIQDLAKKIGARLGQLGKGMNEIYAFAGELLKKGKHFTEHLQKIAAEYINKMAEAYQAATEPFRKAADLAKKGAEWAREKINAFVEGAIALYAKSLETMQSPFKAMAETLKETAKKYQEFVEKTTKWISETLDKNIFSPLRTAEKFISENVKWISEGISKFVEKRISEPTRKVVEKIKDLSKTATDLVRENVEKAKEIAKDIGHRTAELYQKAVEHVPQIAHGVLQGIISVIPQPVINFFIPVAVVAGAFWRAPGNLRKAGKGFMVRMRQLKEWTKSTSKWVIAKVKRGVEKVKKAAILFIEKLKKIPSKVWKFIRAVVAITLEAGKRILFLAKLLFTWLKVLFKYSLIQLRSKLA